LRQAQASPACDKQLPYAQKCSALFEHIWKNCPERLFEFLRVGKLQQRVRMAFSTGLTPTGEMLAAQLSPRSGHVSGPGGRGGPKLEDAGCCIAMFSDDEGVSPFGWPRHNDSISRLSPAFASAQLNASRSH
jgi:hypothetical protein